VKGSEESLEMQRALQRKKLTRFWRSSWEISRRDRTKQKAGLLSFLPILCRRRLWMLILGSWLRSIHQLSSTAFAPAMSGLI